MRYLLLAADIARILWGAVFPVETPRGIITDKHRFGAGSARGVAGSPMGKEENVKKKGKGKPGC